MYKACVGENKEANGPKEESELWGTLESKLGEGRVHI
jgi:hypothetical protein